MERVPKALFVIAIVLVAFLANADGGREISTKEGVVHNPHSYSSYGGGGWFPWFPWFSHFPWWWRGPGGGNDNAEYGIKDMGKGENRVREVPKIDDEAGHGYP
ncbi:hypothetical protein U1Q18_033799 [Sarracenia purpurea var. burkii]